MMYLHPDTVDLASLQAAPRDDVGRQNTELLIEHLEQWLRT